MGKKKERIYEAEDGEECCEIPSSRLDKTIAFMDPEQLCLPEQGLYNIGPVNIPP